MTHTTRFTRTCGAIAVLLGIAVGSTRASVVSHWALDEGFGSGGPALDSADGNNGALAGDASYIAPGKFGPSAITLDGTGDYITAGNPTNLQFDSIAVGTAVAGGPPHRSVREGFPHTAPTSSRARNR